MKSSSVCVADASGEIVREREVASEPAALIGWFASLGFELVRIGLEAGPLSQWLYAAMRQDSTERPALSCYLVFASAGATLMELAGSAGLRWTIEECFQRAKDDLGLDHCEARSRHGWHRHMTLVMAAAAFLTKLCADLRRSALGKANETSPKPAIAA